MNFGRVVATSTNVIRPQDNTHSYESQDMNHSNHDTMIGNTNNSPSDVQISELYQDNHKIKCCSKKWCGFDRCTTFFGRRKVTGVGFVYTHGFAVVWVFLYMLGGFLFFHIDQGWAWYDSLYFSVVTFTTVGYGDLAPTSQSARLFTAIYTLVGAVIVGAIFSVLSEQLAITQLELIRNAEKQRQDYVLRRVSSSNTVSNDDDDLNVLKKEIPSLKDLLKSCFMYILALICVFIMFYFQIMDRDGANDVDENEQFTSIDVFYFMVSTMTTVGYGDISPQTKEARICGIIFIPISVFGMTSILAIYASWRSKRIILKQQIAQVTRGLRYEDLKVMDEDNNGKVSKLEFIEFMLLSTNRVDKDYLSRLHKQFSILDLDNSGFLDMKDLKSKVDEPYRHHSFPKLKGFFDKGAHLKI